MKRRRLAAAALAVGVTVGGTVGGIAVATGGRGDRGFDVTVPTAGAPAAARVEVDQRVAATATAAEATATAESSSVVVIEGSTPSSGRVVVSNNGTATANTGGNAGQNVTTGPATAVANDSVVIIK